ncbi:MAG: hypothetical protein HOP18_06675 [Deltaproteobacteria bacterium]|nr:hypothetical protein [Deltaproteobacteria bacterium]
MAKTTKSEKVPPTMQSTYESIVEFTDQVAAEHLNSEYAQLFRYATAALCRKRPSPLATGHVNTWAAGIAYAIGAVNFLFDKSQTPHLRGEDLCQAFGVSASSGSAKAKKVRSLLGLFQFHPDWTLPSKLERNPLVWTLSVNGLLVDIRSMPREAQEIAYRKDFIPYIPADRQDDTDI